jgi:Ser/Thr protein kinase RdoA (MazF antagonist)
MKDPARLAREHFGLEGRVTPLHGELDLNFAIDGHVLKLHAPGTDLARLDLQDAALEHLAGEPAVPRVSSWPTRPPSRAC